MPLPASSATPSDRPSAFADAQGATPVGLRLRIASMVYESVLVFGVACAALLPLLALTGWTYPLQPYQRWVLQGVLFIAIGAYFVYCWSRGGQTLAMKSWGLRVLAADGRTPSAARAAARYVAAWYLLAPGAAYVALRQSHTFADLLALGTGAAALLLMARADPQHHLLHDRLTRTRLVRVAPR